MSQTQQEGTPTMNYNEKIYTKMPGYDAEGIRHFFHQAIALKTLVITCPDPRASGAAEAVAREFGQTAWPGEILRNEKGMKVGSTTNVAIQITAGGRATDALRSITSFNYLIGLENVVVVHHTWCGLTSWTPETLIRVQKQEFGGDISHAHDHATLSIRNFDESLRYDVDLIRNSPGTAKYLNIFGYVYDTDTDTLIKVIENRGTSPTD